MQFSWPQTEHIYLSPHLDDVILSCGGLLYEQADRGESVNVITFFAGSPTADQKLSYFARSLHSRWQAALPAAMDFSDPPAVRRAEDLKAFHLLHPAIEVMHLPLLDCIYRTDSAGKPLYTGEAAIFGDVSPSEPAIANLEALLHPPKTAQIYAPLGIGNHVDHQLIHNISRQWEAAGSNLLYYEDYPYAADQAAVEAVVTAFPLLQTQVILIQPESIQAQIHAVAAHTSQLSTFWESEAAMANALAEFTARYEGIRLWRWK